MITKESLIAERESVNQAVLKIKQQYSNSPTTKKIILVVEGKDDVPFYGMRAENYKDQGCTICVISAGNRSKVVETYKKLDWRIYSKSKVFFVIDRDLSDYTGEDTPADDNVYVTDNYSIENDICTRTNYIRVIKYLAQLNDIDEVDEAELLSFYDDTERQFYSIAIPIMSLILYWKLNGIKANYANINFNNIFQLNNHSIKIKPTFNSFEEVQKYVSEKSQITYDDSIDLEPYKATLQETHKPIHFIRGKYLSCFFSTILNYTVEHSKEILSSKKEGKLSMTIGNKDLIVKLSGYIEVPNSLHLFFKKLASGS